MSCTASSDARLRSTPPGSIISTNTPACRQRAVPDALRRHDGLDQSDPPGAADPADRESCFPKDTKALIKIAQDYDVSLHRRIRAGGQREPQARDGPQGQPGARRVAARQDHRGARSHLQAQHRRHARCAVDPAGHGPDRHGREGEAFDPVGMEPAKSELPRITYGEDAYSCAEGADAIVIVTEWVQFRALGLDRLKATMAQPVIVDLRNIYRPERCLRPDSSERGAGRRCKRALAQPPPRLRRERSQGCLVSGSLPSRQAASWSRTSS
jgi:hypothetical protein